ncbi:MAG TPA: NAD-dependent succinate-semialdehyde dehydrogenase [Cellvibrionaceae bacterium]
MLNLNDPSLLVLHSLIGGVSGQGLRTYPVINPASEQIIAEISLLEEGMEAQALASAQAAQNPWAGLSGMERGRVLRRWGDLILTNEDDLARLLTHEQGKPLAEARAEIAYAADYFHWFSGEAERMYGRSLPVGAGRRHWVEQRALGVVAAITPWNFPAAMLARKLAAALAAGNAVIAKPAIETPFSALAIAQLGARAGIPDGLVNVLLTDQPERIGEWFCSEPKIAKISFTGSTAVGRWLLARAGDGVKPCTMELGGNAPFIVFADANIPAAVNGFIACKFRNAGQTCISANRLLVHMSIAAEFLSLLRDRLNLMCFGDGMQEGIDLGPLIHATACSRLQQKITDAKDKGAIVESFGIDRRASPIGSFFAPTLVTGVTPEMRLFNEESFGPIVAVTEFATCDEAILLANQTQYGLAAYVYSKDLTTINQCQKLLQFGMLGINEARLSHAYAPFGGIKNSGFGREGGLEGITHYQSQQFIAWSE